MVAVPAPTPVVEAAAGDPAVLGLPIFAAGSVVLGLALVGYVPAAAVGSVVPIVLAGTALGLIVATLWSASTGQTMLAGVFGLFAALVFALVVLALVLLVVGTLNADATLNKVAGYVVLAFAALGLYLFLAAASSATGGRDYPLGHPLVR